MIFAHTSTSGPYWVLLRHAVQVVDNEHASVFEETFNPLSVVPPTMLFVHLAESDSGLSFGRLKESVATSGFTGGTIAAGIAEASFEGGPSPTPFTAVTL